MPNEKQTPDEDESTSSKKRDKYLNSGLSEAEIARRRKLDEWCPLMGEESGGGFSVVGAKAPAADGPGERIVMQHPDGWIEVIEPDGTITICQPTGIKASLDVPPP